jgi:hypothetical protein
LARAKFIAHAADGAALAAGRIEAGIRHRDVGRAGHARHLLETIVGDVREVLREQQVAGIVGGAAARRLIGVGGAVDVRNSDFALGAQRRPEKVRGQLLEIGLGQVLHPAALRIEVDHHTLFQLPRGVDGHARLELHLRAEILVAVGLQRIPHCVAGDMTGRVLGRESKLRKIGVLLVDSRHGILPYPSCSNPFLPSFGSERKRTCTLYRTSCQ